MTDPTTLQQAQAAIEGLPVESMSKDAGVREQVCVGRAHALATLALAEEVAALREAYEARVPA